MWQRLNELFTHTDPVMYAIPFFLITLFGEYFVLRERQKSYDVKDATASVTMGLGSIFTTLIAKSIAYLAFIYIYENYRIFDIPLTWWSVLLLIFADDLSFYWHHRLSHEIRLLWAAHVNHHSSEQYNLATALRQSWTEEIYKFVFWLWLPLLGFHPLLIFTQISISLIYQYWIHTELIYKFPAPIEFFWNTPSHHRVHHASNVRYLDRNYAGIFIIWDRLFGTFAPEDAAEPVKYGITNNIHSYNPIVIATHEFAAIARDWRQAKSWREKWNLLFNAPGWSADGQTKTAKEMQREMGQSPSSDSK